VENREWKGEGYGSNMKEDKGTGKEERDKE
jgi:hypothetical protein